MTRVPSEDAATSGWNQTAEDILVMICERLILPDIIRLGCVCASWRSVTPARHGKLPWLLLPYDNRKGNNSYGFYNVYDQKVYKLELPELARTVIYGCSQGWLITVDEYSRMHLLHPFTRRRIQLPVLNMFPHVRGSYYSREQGGVYELLSTNGYMIRSDSKQMYECYGGKFTLSSSPTSSLDCIVMAIYGPQKKLAFCRPGDNRWTTVQTPWETFHEIIYWNGRFCANDYYRRIVFCEFGFGSSPTVIGIVPSFINDCPEGNYLINSAGELLMVLRYVKWVSDAAGSSRSCFWPYMEFQMRKEYGFKVFKLDFKLQRWIDVKSLGEIMFLSGNVGDSLSFPACRFHSCGGDRIYFTDVNRDSCYKYGKDGVYDLWFHNMVDGTTESWFQSDSQMSMSIPIWITP